MADLLLPVGPRRMSSWTAHQQRTPRSTEPGTDFYCPIGTEVRAPYSGTIYGSGDSITPATGRWVGVDLDTGQRFRCMHLNRLVRTSGRVNRGDVIGISGASGYGKPDWSADPNTGGAHTHVTLWPTHQTRFGYDTSGKPYTIDFMRYVGGSTAGGGGTPLPGEEEDMPLDNADKRIIKDAILEFMLEVEQPPTGYAVWPFIQAAVWGAPIQAQNADGTTLVDDSGKAVVFPASGFLASTNALAHAGATVDVAELVKLIESAGIAEAVADKLAERLKA